MPISALYTKKRKSKLRFLAKIKLAFDIKTKYNVYMKQANLWNNEYGVEKNISTSFKPTVSRSVKYMLDFFSKINYQPKTILDMGCGRGRNAIPLAELGYKVTGIDISSVAIEKAKAACDKAKFICTPMDEELPFEDNSFDVAMDITTFDILITQDSIDRHKAELKRVLKKDGYFLYYDMLDDDPYTLAMGSEDGSIFGVEGKVYYTPTGIAFRTHSLEQVKKIFSDFDVVGSELFDFKDKMDGQDYDRRLLCCLMKVK
jgi:SAM-dependent methyltransferase